MSGVHPEGESHHTIKDDGLHYPDHRGGEVAGERHADGEHLCGDGAVLQGPQHHPQHERTEEQGEGEEERRHAGAEVGRGVLMCGFEINRATDGVGDGFFLLVVQLGTCLAPSASLVASSADPALSCPVPELSC